VLFSGQEWPKSYQHPTLMLNWMLDTSKLFLTFVKKRLQAGDSPQALCDALEMRVRELYAERTHCSTCGLQDLPANSIRSPYSSEHAFCSRKCERKWGKLHDGNATTTSASDAASAADTTSASTLGEGSRVEVYGLKSAVALNGQLGTVGNTIPAPGRLSVVLDKSNRVVSIQRCNLYPAGPRPLFLPSGWTPGDPIPAAVSAEGNGLLHGSGITSGSRVRLAARFAQDLLDDVQVHASFTETYTHV
jgi:hypothetical protein